MAKVTNPDVKGKKKGSLTKPTKVTNPNTKKSGKPTQKRNIKEVPKPEPVPEPPKPRMMEDENVILEHILIRRCVNLIYIAQLSEALCRNANTLIENFLALFSDDEKAQLAEFLRIRPVEITTYENVERLSNPASEVKEKNKALFNILRDLTRELDGVDDDTIPAEIITLEKYAENPLYIVLRESTYVFGIDSYINELKKTNPRLIAMPAIDPDQISDIIINLLMLHIEAWIPNIGKMEFVTQEKIEEYVAGIWPVIVSIAGYAINQTASTLTSNPNTDLFQIIRNTGNGNFSLFNAFKFSGTCYLQVIDEGLVVENEPSLEELLADDGTAEDDVTLMDVINEEK